MRYTLRGIPSPGTSSGEQRMDAEVQALCSLDADVEMEEMVAVQRGGWPDRLRQVLGLERFFGGR
jgi:hypothetical protein